LNCTVDGEKEENEKEQQQEDPQQEPAAAEGLAETSLRDVAAAALQPPLPLEAFVHPGLWWQRQQQLLGLGSACDNCGGALTDNTQVRLTAQVLQRYVQCLQPCFSSQNVTAAAW
jgi:hypothetical protein